MKFQGIVLLCCVLLVKGQQVPTTENHDDDPTTTTASTTTSSSTTTSPPTTTTKEPTTTTPSTPTTVKPSPAPVPPVPDYPKNVGKWSVEDAFNSSCITLKGAIQIVVINGNKTETINVPQFAASTGQCNKEPKLNDIQTITLSWISNLTTPELENSLTFTFESNVTNKNNSVNADSGISVGKYGLQDVQAVLFLESGNFSESVPQIAVFQTPLNHSYSCLAEEAIKSKDGTLSLKFREIQVEAFRLTPAGHREFSAAVQCPADDATDVVPIAVGAALAGLVVIVLIAYLIGRKRSRARGYQSV